jgi:hypothetical protein
MFKNRFLLVLGLISILSVTLAVSYVRPNAARPVDQGASDFYQRHPYWTWTVKGQNGVIPITGASAFPDYFQRHPELTVPSILGLDASDYFMRHPKLSASANVSVDMTDYYFRQAASQPPSRNIDPTDYFFRHS